MVYENLLLERGDGYAVITLNRPKVMNALNRALFAELDDAFAALAGDSAVRAIILTGAGEKAFAAGATSANWQRSRPRTARSLRSVDRPCSAASRRAASR